MIQVLIPRIHRDYLLSIFSLRGKVLLSIIICIVWSPRACIGVASITCVGFKSIACCTFNFSITLSLFTPACKDPFGRTWRLKRTTIFDNLSLAFASLFCLSIASRRSLWQQLWKLEFDTYISNRDLFSVYWSCHNCHFFRCQYVSEVASWYCFFLSSYSQLINVIQENNGNFLVDQITK